MTTLESLEEIIRCHDARMNLLASVAERQQTLLEEIKRDSSQTQRLWVNLSRKYGWLEDGDLL